MKKICLSVLVLSGMVSLKAVAQKLKPAAVPAVVKSALAKKYPASSTAKVTWENEKGNFEANWGGKGGEDSSVEFTPGGEFMEIVKAIPVSQLPKTVLPYVKANYKNAKVTEAGKVLDAKNVTTYEAEVNGKDLIFDEAGKFIKVD